MNDTLSFESVKYINRLQGAGHRAQDKRSKSHRSCVTGCLFKEFNIKGDKLIFYRKRTTKKSLDLPVSEAF